MVCQFVRGEWGSSVLIYLCWPWSPSGATGQTT